MSTFNSATPSIATSTTQAERVAAIVASAPPLTDAQRRTIAGLFRTVRRTNAANFQRSA